MQNPDEKVITEMLIQPGVEHNLIACYTTCKVMEAEIEDVGKRLPRVMFAQQKKAGNSMYLLIYLSILFLFK